MGPCWGSEMVSEDCSWTAEIAGVVDSVIDFFSEVFKGGALDDTTGDGLDGCFVDWRFLRSWLRWPLAVVMVGDRSDSLMRSIPGQDWRSPSLMALRKVEIGGLPHTAWRYLARSFVVCFLRMMTLAVWHGNDDGDDCDGAGI